MKAYHFSQSICRCKRVSFHHTGDFMLSNMSHFSLPVRVFMQQRIFLIYCSVKTSSVFSPDTTILGFPQY